MMRMCDKVFSMCIRDNNQWWECVMYDCDECYKCDNNVMILCVINTIRINYDIFLFHNLYLIIKSRMFHSTKIELCGYIFIHYSHILIINYHHEHTSKTLYHIFSSHILIINYHHEHTSKTLYHTFSSLIIITKIT